MVGFPRSPSEVCYFNAS